MIEFWNERYGAEVYAYGTKPNDFFKDQLDKLSGKRLLLPAEGEGRNAVYAAQNGWEVKAFDTSEKGREKALKLASENKVSIDYEVAGFDQFKAESNTFDVIALIYAHVPSQQRKAYFQKCIAWLKPGGTLILEGFSKQQLGLESGGPKALEMLFSIEELTDELEGLTFEATSEERISLNEGEFHVGEGEVVRMVAKKPLVVD